jgi:hypothetical protein
MVKDPNIIGAVRGALRLPHRELAAKLKKSVDPIQTLTEIERTPGLGAELFGVVAAAKKALATENESDEAEFWKRAGKYMGV